MTRDVVGEREVVEWRPTSLRKWWPILMVASFVGDGTSSVLRLTTRGPSSLPRAGDVIFVVFAGLGLVAAVILLVTTLRTRVTLQPDGIAVTVVRRRFIAYREIGRAYRDRWSSGAVTLQLRDGRKVVLPAPTAGLGSPDPRLDDAVDLVQQRIASSTMPG